MTVRGTDFRWMPAMAAAVAAGFWFARQLLARVRDRVRAAAAGSWPTAEARVEGFYVLRNRANRRYGAYYLPVLQYSYSVQGERASGEFNLGIMEADRDAASEVGKRWVGQKIRIRFRPTSPCESIWLQQDGAPPGTRSAAPEGSDDSLIDPELNR